MEYVWNVKGREGKRREEKQGGLGKRGRGGGGNKKSVCGMCVCVCACVEFGG